MNILSNFSLLLLCIITGCDKDSHIDYSSFNIKPEIISSQEQQGFIITDTCSPFNIPLDFTNLKNSSRTLINSDWLSNPHYLEDINNLIYLFNQAHISDSDVFINSLNNSALIYKNNMIEVNSLKRKLQTDINNKLNYYQQAIASITTRLSIMKMDEKQHIENVAMIKSAIKEKQNYYTKLRRNLTDDLSKLQLNDSLIFDLISEIKFKYKAHSTVNCSKYLGSYQQVTFPSTHACIYYNNAELIAKVPTKYQQQVNTIFDKHVPNLWNTMLQLNGYFASNYNKQVFDSYLQKDLVIATNNLAIKRTLNDEKQPCNTIDTQLKTLEKLNAAMTNDINKLLLDDNNEINISSPDFYTKLTPLLINGKVKDPIINFSLLYNNRVLIKNFTKEYATKILNEYPKSLTFVVADNGTFTLPKIRAKHYKVVIDIKENCSIVYDGRNILVPPTAFTKNTPHTTSVKYNLDQIISQQLFNQWFNT
ncbi:hypothetical protein C0W54_19970 [Photobacterium kishitanii]|nr:hypothetical protein C0W54_19970 [Photobacterium kishitanii]